jgi:hypothetical protein
LLRLLLCLFCCLLFLLVSRIGTHESIVVLLVSGYLVSGSLSGFWMHACLDVWVSGCLGVRVIDDIEGHSAIEKGKLR